MNVGRRCTERGTDAGLLRAHFAALVLASLATPLQASGQGETEPLHPPCAFPWGTCGPPPYGHEPTIGAFTDSFALQDQAEWMRYNLPASQPLPAPAIRCYAMFRPPHPVTLFSNDGAGALCELNTAAGRYVLLRPAPGFRGYEWQSLEPRTPSEDSAPRVAHAQAVGIEGTRLPEGDGCAADDIDRVLNSSYVVLQVVLEGDAEFILLDACAEICPDSWGFSHLAYGPLDSGETEFDIRIQVESLQYDGCLRVSASNLYTAESHLVEVRW